MATNQNSLNNETFANFTINDASLRVGEANPLVPVNVNVETNSPGGVVELEIRNLSSAASSNALLGIVTTLGTSGDPYITYNVAGVLNWSHGIDNSDSDKFKISAFGSLGTNDSITITTAGVVSQPLQPSFSVSANTTANLTGNGTVATVPFDQVGHDIGGNFNAGTYTFTCPVAGTYLFTCAILCSGITTCNSLQFQFQFPGAITQCCSVNASAAAASGGFYGLTGSTTAVLNAGDTVFVELVGNGQGADTVGITNSTPFQTIFTGCKIA